jgi:hypothetical protein
MTRLRLLSLALALVFALLPRVADAKPLKTGQKNCWNTAGTKVRCAGKGHDGDLRKGKQRGYVDNGDGTITDTGTGLMWEKLDESGGIHDKDNLYTWTAAITDKIATLNTPPCFAGHCNWRLPNINELRSLVDYGRSPPVPPAFNASCTAACTIATCSCTKIFGYWSSTTYDLQRDQAWIVYLSGGYTTPVAKAGGDYVRAVRGRSS